MDHGLRRGRLWERLTESGVDALLVTHRPNVRYLTGFTGSSGQVIVSADEAVFLTDGRYGAQSRREVPDLERRVSTGAMHEAVAEACRSLGVRRLGFESAGLVYATYLDLAQYVDTELVAVSGAVERLRWVKDPEELAAIERAQEVTDAAFEEILLKLAEGTTERELALELEWAMRRAGADGLAFDPIVAFGENAAEPHHDPTDRPLRRGDVVKLDFGALADGYHADMTRTVSLGEPPPELRRVHDLVGRAQRAGVEAVAAGVPAADVDSAARRVIDEGGLGDAFSHSLGHGVGLEIHEGPKLGRSSEDVLPAAAVVTVEPGVYLPGVGGVRIEDMVVVTDGGCRVLPSSARDLVTV